MSQGRCERRYFPETPGNVECHASVGRVTPATLSEVGVDAIELPPGNRHLIAIRRINRDGGLIRSVAQDVVAVCIDVSLVLVNTSNCEIIRGDVSIFRGAAGGMLVIFRAVRSEAACAAAPAFVPESCGSTSSEVRPMKKLRVKSGEYLI